MMKREGEGGGEGEGEVEPPGKRVFKAKAYKRSHTHTLRVTLEAK